MNQNRWREQGHQQPSQAAGATLCSSPPVVPPPSGQPPATPIIELTVVEQLLSGLQQLVSNVIGVLTAGIHQGYVPANTVLVDMARPVYEMPFEPPVFELHLQNDGPNTVQFRIPNVGNPGWAFLNPTEEIWIKFNRPLINQVGLAVAFGTANVRLVGVR